ncbi:MAG TPA: lytic transglycosylase domain-containing protein [Anaeromyxobacteraceae bacterium]|nr:lytic transglycosylase domain-containing protein [Anaeromyxobacteraceae bacterium]
MKALLVLLLFPLAAPAGGAAAPGARPPFTEADLAPAFASPELAEASEDLEAGRYAAAAAGFARSSAPEARYAEALALFQGGEGEKALPALAGLEEGLPALADRIQFLRGQAALAGGDLTLAAGAFGAVNAGSLLWPDARVALARVRSREDDPGAALEALGPVLALSPPDELTRSDPAAEALLLAGRLRAARRADGDLALARQHLLDCWAGHPLSGLAEACRADLDKLPEAAGAPPEDEVVVRRAEALLDGNRNGQALAELVPLVARLSEGGAESLSCRAHFALGRAYRRTRANEKALESLTPVVERCFEPALRVRALYLMGSAAAVVHPDQGVTFYRALAHDYPASPLADDALFYAADLLARAGKADEALALLGKLAAEYKEGDFRPEALFRSAWLARQAHRMKEALGALAELAHDYESSDPYEYARAVYWRARFLAERGGRGDRAQARAAFTALARRYPLEYYGLLARARLEERWPGSTPPWPRPPPGGEREGLRYDAGPLPADRHFRAGVALLRMGLLRVAADELDAVDRKASLGPEPLLLLAELTERAGDHKSAHNLVRALARSYLGERPEGLALRVFKVAYPKAFRDEVERWARPSGVAPDLLHALMREESGLDPNVVSPAGAVGLTQLMLSTAQGVAKRLGLGTVREADLMNPPVAIRIGASYLGGLLKRFRGSEALALAAYNVGEAPVRGWLRERGGLPLDAFVEEIPVQETRGYVKRVLRSYAVYRALYGSPDARPVLVGQALPEVKAP